METAQQQRADLCRNTSRKAVVLDTILLGVGGTCYTEHTLSQFKLLGLDHQLAIQLACKLHAHPLMYADKLVTTRHAIESNNTSHSQVLEPTSWWRGLAALLSQCVFFSSIDVGKVSSAYLASLFMLQLSCHCRQ
eukprot:1140533-Pelagomonas_calceolata.AAC.1